MTLESQQALSVLRSTDSFGWHVLFGLGLLAYVYINEISRKNWDAVLMGLLFSAGEFIWEMMNALLLRLTGYAGLWTTPGDTSFLILSGINIEILLLFSIAGVGIVKLLQTFDGEPSRRILGIPYRVFMPLCFGMFCVAVECGLNRFGALVWTYKYWSWPHVWSVVVNYMTPSFLCTWGHYRVSRRGKGLVLAVLLCVNVAMWILFVNILGWI